VIGQPANYEKIKKLALAARANAYAPYSCFAVGAAVETETGKFFSGCNVENSSFGLTNCAERSAVFNAVSAGERALRRLAVVADTPLPVAPCGACRQVMCEFGIKEVVMFNTAGETKVVQLAELLPYAFGLDQVKGAEVCE
jgi:cytidine deaminase